MRIITVIIRIIVLTPDSAENDTWRMTDDRLLQTLHPRWYRAVAEMVLDRPTFEWIEAGRQGGSADESAFARWRFRPRVLADVSVIDTTVVAAGARLKLPILAGPMGMLGVVHPDGDQGLAAAVADAGGLTVVATNATSSIEQIAVAAAAGAAPWLQLGSWPDRDATHALVERAQIAGAGAIVPLVNSPVAAQHVQPQVGFRPRVVDLPNAPANQMPDPAQGVEFIEWLVGSTNLPVIPKGVMDGRDARRLVDAGAAGVIVSNHGGRQLKRAIGTLDALPGVVAAVGAETEVYLDGGVRHGTDVLVALALGARAVLIGNPLALALAVGGRGGVQRAIEVLGAELHEAAALCGVTRLGDATPDLLVG
jgi:4-hydroxymandelate oxidase